MSGIIAGVTKVTNLTLMMGGDSLTAALAENSTNRDAMIADFATLGMTVTVTDGSQRGANLMSANDTDDFWNTTTQSKGTLYLSLWDTLPNKALITDIVLSLGTNDRQGLSTGTVTELQFKTAFENLINLMKTDFASLKRIYIMPSTRNNAENNTTLNPAWDVVRRVQRNLTSISGVYLLPEQYDIANQDDMHLTNAGELEYITKVTKRIGFITGNTALSFENPIITSAEVTDLGVEFTIEHKNGNDVTVAGASPRNFYTITDALQSSGLVDLSGYSIERLTASKIRLNSTPLTGAVIGMGAMGSLATVNNTPVVVRDNSVNTLPLRFDTLVPTDDNVIRKLGNIQAMFEASYRKTYQAGNTINNIEGVNGRQFPVAFTTYPTFDATRFGGKGGIVTSAITERLINTTSFVANMVIGGVCEIPLSPANNCDIFMGGLNGTSGATNTTLHVLASNGNLRWNNGQSAVINFGGNYRGQKFAWIIHFKSLTQFDIYINSVTPLAINQDPNDEYATRNRFIAGGGGTIHGMIFMNHGDIANGYTIADAMNYMKTEYGIA